MVVSGFGGIIYRGYTEDDILSKYVGDSFVNHDTRIPIKQLNY